MSPVRPSNLLHLVFLVLKSDLRRFKNFFNRLKKVGNCRHVSTFRSEVCTYYVVAEVIQINNNSAS